MNIQQTSFDAEPSEIVHWASKARTASFNERDIIQWIIQLFNGGAPIEADACYSTGRFWKGLTPPRYKFDLKPQAPGVIQADCRMLPLADGSISSLMFDPPFTVRANGRPFTKKFHDPSKSPNSIFVMHRFFAYPTTRTLFAFYASSLQEFYRALAPGGLLVIKIQNCVNGKERMWSSDHIKRKARGYFTLEEEFVLLADSVAWRMEPKYHARAAHCFFLVFRRMPD